MGLLRGHSLLYESIELLRPIDLDMRNVFCGECDIEVLVVIARGGHGVDSFRTE